MCFITRTHTGISLAYGNLALCHALCWGDFTCSTLFFTQPAKHCISSTFEGLPDSGHSFPVASNPVIDFFLLFLLEISLCCDHPAVRSICGKSKLHAFFLWGWGLTLANLCKAYRPQMNPSVFLASIPPRKSLCYLPCLPCLAPCRCSFKLTSLSIFFITSLCNLPLR